jgi:hypothetical protein
MRRAGARPFRRHAAPLRATALAVALGLLSAAPARAHDTWLAPLPSGERGERVLALGTGERFPQHQGPVPVEQLAEATCHGQGAAAGRPWPLRWAADRLDALWLRTTRPVPTLTALDCRVQTRPTALELDPALVPAYLDEARADAALRQRWQALQAQGRPWRERFRKHARWIDAPTGGADTGAAPPPPLPLDLELTLPPGGPQRGDRLRARLLWQGQPLPGHALELRNDLSPVGLWLRTDAEGVVELPLPLAARWLVRSILLRPAADEAWDSDFLGVSFDVRPAAAR